MNKVYTIQEFFKNRKILISDLEKFSVEDLYKNSVENQYFISNIFERSNTKKLYIVKKKSENTFHLLTQRIDILKYNILASSIFFVLYKRNMINNMHNEIFQDILKSETLYHVELNNFDNHFFRDFIINRTNTNKNINLSNFAIFLKLTFYSFWEEIESLRIDEINNLLTRILNQKLSVQCINFN